MIHCFHVIVRILRVQVIEQPVSIHMPCICFFELGYVFMALSLFAWFVKEYAQFIVILYLVQQYRIWHDQNGPAMHHIGSNCNFFFNCVYFSSLYIGIRMWNDLSLHWVLTVLILGRTNSKMYRSMFIMNQNQLPIQDVYVGLIVCFLYCLHQNTYFKCMVFVVAINNNFD